VDSDVAQLRVVLQLFPEASGRALTSGSPRGGTSAPGRNRASRGQGERSSSVPPASSPAVSATH